ncbi:hypothetical protein LAT59_02020 [Candidatus Gracilibacteria bacterium]|nr:hypothetical protein [Candidatus Gracilibacteria bacterium]
MTGGFKGVSADEYQMSQQRFIITLKNEILKDEVYGRHFIKIVDNFFKNYGDDKEKQQELFSYIHTKWNDFEFGKKDSIMSFSRHEEPYNESELLVRDMLIYIELMLDRYSYNFQIDTASWKEKTIEELGLSFMYPDGYSIRYSEYFSGRDFNLEELLSFGGGVVILSGDGGDIRIMIGIDGHGPNIPSFINFEIEQKTHGSLRVKQKIYNNFWHQKRINTFPTITVKNNNWVGFDNSPKSSINKRVFEVFLENVKILD